MTDQEKMQARRLRTQENRTRTDEGGKMNMEYSNQSEIDKVQKEISEIHPNLKITCFSCRWNTSHVFEVGVSLLLKGNKEIINKLISIGFVKGHKRMVGNTWSLYSRD